MSLESIIFESKHIKNSSLAVIIFLIFVNLRSIARDEDNPERGGDVPGVRVPEVLLPDDVLLQRRPA